VRKQWMTWLASCLGLAVAFGTAEAALAQAKIERVRLSLTDRAEDALPDNKDLIVPSGTDTVYIIIDYKGAARAKIGVEVISAGVLLFEKTSTQSGDGTTTVKMTGVEILRNFTQEIVDFTDAVVSNASSAQNQQYGNAGFLKEASTNVTQLRTSMDVLGRMALDAGLAGEREDLDSAVQGLEELSASVESGASVERIKAVAKQMVDQGRSAQDIAKSLKDAAGKLTSLPIPDTGAERGAAYDLIISVGDNAADSKEFWVTSAAPPVASATAEGGARAAGGTAEPTATARSGGATPTTIGALSGRTTRRSSGSSAGGASRPTPADGASQRMTAAAASAGTPAGDTAGGAPDRSPPGTADTAAGVSDATAAAGDLAPPEAVPTWTIPAIAEVAVDNPTGPPAGSADAARSGGGASGPSLAVLGIGVMALIAVAAWLRRRV